MLYYLMLESCGKGAGPEYGLNRCQDMATVVGCLINAGTFTWQPLLGVVKVQLFN